MINALFAFEDRDAADRAAERLLADGLPAQAIQIHANTDTPNAKLATDADEMVTGGIVSNMMRLFQGVFDWGGSPHDASAFENTIRRGGAVVSVDAESDAARDKADRAMQAAECTQRTEWLAMPGS